MLDNGPEFIAKALEAKAYGAGVELAFSRPVKPVDNCYIESFHGKFRGECLNMHWFLNFTDTRAIISAWRDDYNAVRPPSGLGGRTPKNSQRCCEPRRSWCQLRTSLQSDLPTGPA